VSTVGREVAYEQALAGVRALLVLLGEDPEREGLQRTPERVVKSYLELADRPGDPAELLSVTFAETVPDQLIAVGPIPFTSLCEHHLLPFSGTAWLGYIPAGDRVVGLSKLGRLLDHFARRPQVQERLTGQIADALEQHLAPLGAGCLIRASHSCMALRGARKDSMMVTSALRGIIKDESQARAEFLSLSVS
jgi:GTP cyclohydrolase I